MTTDQPNTTIHATAVLCGARAVLIRGPAGAGKSQLAMALIDAAATGLIRFARLIGIRRVACEPVAVVGLVVDLAAGDAERLPSPPQTVATLAGITVPRIAVGAGRDPFPSVIAALRTPEGG